MIQQWFHSNLLKTTKILVVEVVYHSNDAYSLIPLLVKQKKDEIVWEAYDEEFESLDALKKKVKTTHPIVLSLTGKGIISRVLQEEQAGEEAVLRVMPNINLSEFYWNATSTESHTLVAITRKRIVEELYEEFKEKGFRVLDICLGPTSVNPQLLGRNYDTINFSVYQAELKEEAVEKIKVLDGVERQNYSISGQLITSNQLNALFVGVQFLTESLEREISEDYCDQNVKEEGLKQVFDKGVILIVLVYFGLLLSNFFIKDYYAVEFSELNSSMQFYIQKKNELDKLSEDLEYKKTLLFSSGIMDGNNITKFSDEIGNSVPNGIVLSRLSIAPIVSKKRKKKEKIRYDKNTILLEGQAKNSRNFNNWVVELRELEWQKNLTISDYSRNPKTGWSDFIIEIEIDR